eukprot:4248627-Pleurochrysis_carterae.AAC.1
MRAPWYPGMYTTSSCCRYPRALLRELRNPAIMRATVGYVHQAIADAFGPNAEWRHLWGTCLKHQEGVEQAISNR